MAKVALITGVSGQDGALLARFLLSKGYLVHGTSRDKEGSSLQNLRALGISNEVSVHSMVLNDFRNVLDTLRSLEPSEVYHLAGQSSVGRSFLQPAETLESITMGVLNLLEAIRFLGKPIKLYNAGSSESFGSTDSLPFNELSNFAPRSPYAVAKAAAFWEVSNYRDAYGVFSCTGILFNHESMLRHKRFVTQKIARAVARIAKGSSEKLELGNIDISRDWGWAPEYVEAMWLMLQQERPDDFVIATGVRSSLRDFIASAFSTCGLDWMEHVVVDSSLFRPSEISQSFGDPTKAMKTLGWRAKTMMPEVAEKMVLHNINNGSR